METKVVNIHHNAQYDVYIGRPSKWGNPFSHLPSKGLIKVETRQEAIDAYRWWINLPENAHLIASLHELKGKTLGCYCAPKPCHGNVLIELINGSTQTSMDDNT